MWNYVNKCPRCGSRDIIPWTGGKGGIVYYCKSCNYKGPLKIKNYEEN